MDNIISEAQPVHSKTAQRAIHWIIVRNNYSDEDVNLFTKNMELLTYSVMGMTVSNFVY